MSTFSKITGAHLASALLASLAAIYKAHSATGGPKDSLMNLQSLRHVATNTWDAKANQQMDE